ncbi:MAG: ATP-dependent DNA ligase [Nitrososphaeraceae archaeon]
MYFSNVVDTFEKMEQTTSRLMLTDYLVCLLKKTPSSTIDKVVYLIQGKLYPDYEGIQLGLAEKMVLRALSQSIVGSLDIGSLSKIYRETGDLGDTARKIIESKKNKRQSTTLFPSEKKMMTVERVYLTLDKIARTTGPGSQELKIRLVSGLLNDSTAREARFIIKLIMGKLRLGIADYTVMDALAIAFTGNKQNRSILENAYNVSSDLGNIAKILATNGIESVKLLQITLYKPIRPMLAERVVAAEEALERMNGIAAAEYKLDGERIQIHKGKERVELFSRRLEKITHHFPDIVEAITKSLKSTEEVILEGEAVAIDLQTSEFLPFQELMHRRRKHGIQEAMEDYPVILNVFDVLFVNGNAKTSLIYSQRRDLIEKMIVRQHRPKNNADDNNNKIRIVPQTIVNNTDQIDKFMTSAIESGCEGLMIKHLNSVYRAGAREYAWIKLKLEYQSELADTLDLVIVGALYGRGRRVGKYGALLLAAYDSASDIFRSTCKVGTGFTDKDLEGFYVNLEKHKIEHKHPRVDTRMQMDVWFEPKIIIEVIASEVTLSPSHTAAMASIRPSYGLALRFPKFTGKIRDDKNPEDATDVGELISMYKQQMQQVLHPDKS